MSAPLVYVADDEPDLAELMAETLLDAGFEVATEPDGGRLLARVGERKPDVILLDINMPGLTGWDVRRRLLEDASTAGIPVIAVTAQGGATIETSAMRTLRFDGFVRKPFKLGDLVERVEQALAKKQP